MPERTYRRGTLDDIDFLVAALIGAERSGGAQSLYERLFDFGEPELAALLKGLFLEDVPGSELCCESFWLAIEAGRPAGCVATWVEAGDGPPSHFVRASLLSHALGVERWKLAAERLRALAPIDIARTAGTLQIEGVYVSPAHRGQGVVGDLLEHALRAAPLENASVRRAQILSVVGNESSSRAFEKAGFVVAQRSESDDPRVSALFPGRGRLLWERALA
jgi:GNAT superfamily N-acetyltransferase